MKKKVIIVLLFTFFNISYGDSEKIEVKIAVFPFKPMIYQKLSLEMQRYK